MLKEGVILGERYEIISRIGSGGMADVYKAKDQGKPEWRCWLPLLRSVFLCGQCNPSE